VPYTVHVLARAISATNAPAVDASMADKQQPCWAPWPIHFSSPCYQPKHATVPPRPEDATPPLHRCWGEPSSLHRRRHAARAALAHGQVAMSHLWASYNCLGMRMGLLPLLHYHSSLERCPGWPGAAGRAPPLFPGEMKRKKASRSLSVSLCE
jgi:hypothetical protein